MSVALVVQLRRSVQWGKGKSESERQRGMQVRECDVRRMEVAVAVSQGSEGRHG